MYFLLGLSITLAAMLVVNSLASLLLSLLWKAMRKGALRWPAANRASMLYALRVLPVAAGLFCVVMLFAPAYLAHEPRAGHEDVSANLAIVSLFSALGIGMAVVRGIVTCRVTARLTADWLRKAEAIDLPGIGVPAYRMEHLFPVIAVVGVLHPRLFVANQIFNSLTSEELSAAIQHEAGHIVARDNLKRGLMRACRDTLLIIPCGRPLDIAWKEASEAAADENAARGGAKVALDLASALIKIARMVPAGMTPAMPAAALLVSANEVSCIGERVRRLLQLANPGTQRRGSMLANSPLWISTGLMIVLAAITINEPHVLAVVHSLIEHGVQFLG